MSEHPRNMSAVVDSLLRMGLGSDAASLRSRELAQEALGLDDLNWSYFFSLYRSKVAGSPSGAQKKGLWIYEADGDPRGRLPAFPVAIAPQELLKSLRLVEYTDLLHSPERYDEVAKDAALWVKKMQAGSGSSMTRATYLQRELGIPLEEVRIGAKGTDLFIQAPSRIPLAEAQIIQTIRDVERGEIGEVLFHDIVSSETKESLHRLWNKSTLDDPSRTYEEMIQQHPRLSHFGETFQSFIPTLDENGRISFNRLAPGGHALFAVDALRAAYQEKLRPKTSRPLIAAISNGEDLSSAPDRFMIGYMIKHRAPIVLVTTERTPVDAKGGLLSLLQDEAGAVSLTVLETAQAKEAGQESLFSRLPGMVSTNLTLFNYEVLAPLITQEVKDIGEDRFMEIISPDLISNTKEQRDADGVTRKYLQLEGAMGSTIMNLDRYWRSKYGEPLVHVINVDRGHRTEFFSPVKSAFDYFMQFHSDRFVFDPRQMRLRNLRPGELPQISLKDPQTGDKFYQDVQNVLECFRGASIKDLDELALEGQVSLENCQLRGRVRILNPGRIPRSLSGMVLHNTALEFGMNGEPLKIQPI